MASKAQTVLEALRTALESNCDATIYRPDLVRVVLFWPDEKQLPSTMKTIYLIRPAEVFGGPGPDSCSVTETMEVYILAATRFKNPGESPFSEDEEVARWKVSTDLVADVGEKLRQSEKLGGEALTVFVGPAGGQVDVTHERYLPRWVCPEIRLSVKYRYDKDAR